jgi:hypothetical protein
LNPLLGEVHDRTGSDWNPHRAVHFGVGGFVGFDLEVAISDPCARAFCNSANSSAGIFFLSFAQAALSLSSHFSRAAAVASHIPAVELFRSMAASMAMSIESLTSLPSPLGMENKIAAIKKSFFMEWDTALENKYLDRIYKNSLGNG